MAKETRILIIHGWSDCSESFVTMKDYLIAQGVGQVQTVYYADYESREDNMTYEDIIEGLNNQLVSEKLITNTGDSPYDLKIIVHSTGGLVVRHWLWRYYQHTQRMDRCPVSHLVMLAPANFGSPLAQMGKSFLGGLVKGRWKVGDMLETGRIILNGLELGSAYQWQLAHRDLLSGTNYFAPEKIITTVLVGNTDYRGIRGWLNKPGTDGTVVISGTNLNSAKLCLKFSVPETLNTIALPHQWETTKPVSNIAFGILKDYDHGSIVDCVGKEVNSPFDVNKILMKALSVAPDQFPDFQKELADLSELGYSQSGLAKFQQFLVHAIDYQEQSAMDFTLDFSVYKKEKYVDQILNESESPGKEESSQQSKEEYDYSVKLNELINKETHTYSIDSSYRRLLVDTDALAKTISTMDAEPAFTDGYGIFMKVFVPSIDDNIGYYTKNLQNILIYDSKQSNPGVPKFFFANTTTLLEIQVDRINSNVWVSTEPKKH